MPFRRFVQHETFSPQANEIPNTAASWLPGDDYYVNFHRGDPFIKVDKGDARLPGAGYAALHPELEDVSPEDYPDSHKLSILSDVAPYSREYNTYRQTGTGKYRTKGDCDGSVIEVGRFPNSSAETKRMCCMADSDTEQDDALPLSGLQHLAFCPRQWAPIHLEQV